MDTRYKQRFQNFKRAYGLLSQALQLKTLDEYSDLELEGIIQRFEYTFELGWKVFKDYLEYSGVLIEEATPRKIIKTCTEQGIFLAAKICPDTYLQMMLERNALSHTYNFERFKEALVRINTEYLPQLLLQHTFFLNKESE